MARCAAGNRKLPLAQVRFIHQGAFFRMKNRCAPVAALV